MDHTRLWLLIVAYGARQHDRGFAEAARFEQRDEDLAAKDEMEATMEVSRLDKEIQKMLAEDAAPPNYKFDKVLEGKTNG